MRFFLEKVEQYILDGYKECRAVLLLSLNISCQFLRRDFAQIGVGFGFNLFQIFRDFLDAVVFVIVEARIIGIALQCIINIGIHHKDDMQTDVSQGRETAYCLNK